MELNVNKIFQSGMETGCKKLMDHIQHQHKIGKPVEINGELYWMKDSKEHLIDVMCNLDNAWNEKHGEKKYIVPIRMFHNTSTEVKELLVKAPNAHVAMLIALGFEKEHHGWIVDEDYENYKQVKIIWDDMHVKN